MWLGYGIDGGPPPRKKAKLEEQMKAIKAKLEKLKLELNNMVATPPWR